MSLLRTVVTRNVKLTNYFKKQCLRKYSSAVLKSPLGEIQVPDQTFSDFVFSNSTTWEKKTALVNTIFKFILPILSVYLFFCLD